MKIHLTSSPPQISVSVFSSPSLARRPRFQHQNRPPKTHPTNCSKSPEIIFSHRRHQFATSEQQPRSGQAPPRAAAAARRRTTWRRAGFTLSSSSGVTNHCPRPLDSSRRDFSSRDGFNEIRANGNRHARTYVPTGIGSAGRDKLLARNNRDVVVGGIKRCLFDVGIAFCLGCFVVLNGVEG